jgi:3-phenylpropionate/cinnamic acid dioxygenase small subunit
MSDLTLPVDDVVALHQLCARYAHVVDDADFDALDQIFTDDVIIEVPAFKLPAMVGIDAVRASYADSAHPVAHHVTNVVVTRDDDGTVRIRSKVLSLLGGGLCGSGTYDDIAVQTDAGWRISHRLIGLRRERDLAKPPPPPAR